MKTKTILIVLFTLISMIAFAQEKLPDQEIEDVIENQINYDHAINTNNLNINSVDGIVELTGWVTNIKAKERAADIAGLVKGVRSVSNRIEIKTREDISDKDIKTDIMASLLSNPATESYKVDVDVSNGIVELTGTVDSYREKQLCENVAKSVDGVKKLENKIDIEYDVVRRDAEIKYEIEQALKWSKLVDDALIEVEVNDGIVELSGSVASLSEKNHANFLALTTGVKEVKTEDLDVEWWVPSDKLTRDKDVYASDQEAELAILDAAKLDPRLYSTNIEVEVGEGIATLRGTVDNMQAKQAAENIARNTMGVKSVNNRIKVYTEFPPKDDEIRENVLHALARNSITESYQIVVDVNAGIVTLTGVVDSHLEKLEAENTAGKIKGVTGVNNNLHVEKPYSYYFWDELPFYDWYFVPDISSRVISVSTIDDEEIKRNVQNELLWSPFIDQENINVSVNNGKVTLTGTVPTHRAYNKATQNAYEGGAWHVENNILVK